MISTAFTEALADRYRIGRELGHGGMAIVYLADDLKHSRPVAIKVLNPEIAAVIGHARFLREIELAARLNHPHILTLHDSGVADGQLYYVMPYIGGESLRERLERVRQLPFEEALRLAGEIGEALEYAHRQGVIHRDIKPENIMISEGHALVTDFGIAKAVGTAGGPGLTTATTLLGTPAYMSPEQWSGPDAPIDGRSDVYSLACLVYEMLAGQPPFTGPSTESVAHQHLSLEPRLVSALRATVPDRVARELHRGLAKAAADRPGSAVEFVAGLSAAVRESARRGRGGMPRAAVVAGATILIAIAAVVVWRSRHPSPDEGSRNSIAVLPLDDFSGDSEQGYFAAGMTDELITCLAKISSLTVIANSASSTYRHTQKPLARIARELAVRFILEGSVARSSGKVRIDTRLIDASTGRNLWAERYEREGQDVIALQGDVALAVAQQIRASLTPAERASISSPRKVNPEAHELYLKARFSIDPGTRQGAQRGIQLFKQALQLDPDYALAYAGLADDYFFMSGWYLPSHEAMPLARQCSAKALDLDSTLAEALTIRGLVTYFYDWKFNDGLDLLRKAVELNPGSALTRQWYAYTLDAAGRFDAARGEFAQALQLDPVSEQLRWFATWPSYYERHFDQAIGELNRIRAEDPGFWPTYSLLGEAHESLGNLPLALDELRRARDLGGNPWVVAAIARVEAEAGRAAEARRILRGLQAARETTYVQTYALALVQARLGEPDSAFALLEESFRDRSEDVTMLSVDPRADPLRSDPRFVALMRRVGLP